MLLSDQINKTYFDIISFFILFIVLSIPFYFIDKCLKIVADNNISFKNREMGA